MLTSPILDLHKAHKGARLSGNLLGRKSRTHSCSLFSIGSDLRSDAFECLSKQSAWQSDEAPPLSHPALEPLGCAQGCRP